MVLNTIHLKLAFLLPLLVCWHGVVQGDDKQPALLASLEFDRREAFIKEQILVTLRIGYPSAAFGMTHTPLSVRNADLYTLTKTKYAEAVNGVPYEFVQTHYAIFGNAVGPIEVSAMTFDALLPVAAGGAGSTVNPKLAAALEPQSLIVLELPDNNGAPTGTSRWLAASNVALTGDWMLTDEAMNPGIPVQRRVIIELQGQHPAAAPAQLDWAVATPDGLRIYPAAVSSTINKTERGLGGTVILPVSVVASNTGTFQIPEIKIPWWDINQHQWRYATLAAQNIDVVNANASAESSIFRKATIALGMLSAGLALWCFTLWRQLTGPANSQRSLTEKQLWNALRTTIKRKRLSHLRDDTLSWAKVFYNDPSIILLDQLCDRHPRLRDTLGAVDGFLYGDNSDREFSFNSNELLAVLSEIRRDYLARLKSDREDRGLYPSA